jgi:hypothetical protein
MSWENNTRIGETKIRKKRLKLEKEKLYMYKIAGRIEEFEDRVTKLKEAYTTYDMDQKELEQDRISYNRDGEQISLEWNDLKMKAKEHNIDLAKKDWYISLVKHAFHCRIYWSGTQSARSAVSG